MINGDFVSLIPSMSPAPAKKTKKRKRTPNPSATYEISPALGPKKRKTKSGTTLMSLPYDLLLNCLARVSRLYYPTLSLVSKKLRSLLASSDLHKARSHTTTEICLYVCLTNHKKSRWFTLCRKKKGYALARVPIPYSPRAYDSDLVAAGSSIYHIARCRLCIKPATVSILDCRSHAHHTWREAPSMRLWLNSYTACVVDGNIYVGGFDEEGVNYIEAFDTKTEMWDPDVIPCSEIYDGLYDRTVSIGGKLHVLHSPLPEVVAYNSKEGRWDIVEQGPSRSLGFVLGSEDPYCEIDNVLYSVDYGVIRWYDTEVRRWRELKGLVGLPKFPCKTDHAFLRLTDYGGKMMVFWDKSNYDGRMMIWCAEIALERRHQSGEIWGQVEWFDHVLTSRSRYDFFKVLAVTV